MRTAENCRLERRRQRATKIALWVERVCLISLLSGGCGVFKVMAADVEPAKNLIRNPSFEQGGLYPKILPLEGTEILAQVDGKPAGIALRKAGKGQVVFVGISPGSDAFTGLSHSAATGMTVFPGNLENILTAALDYCLGTNKPLNYLRDFTRYEAVEATLLEESPRIKTFFMINYEDHDVSVHVGVPNLPPGKYRVMERSLRPTDLLINELARIKMAKKVKSADTGPAPELTIQADDRENSELNDIAQEIVAADNREKDDGNESQAETPEKGKDFMAAELKQFAYQDKSTFQAEELESLPLEIPGQGIRILHITPEDYKEMPAPAPAVISRGFYIDNLPGGDLQEKVISRLKYLRSNLIVTSVMGRELRHTDEQFRTLLEDFHTNGIGVANNDLCYSWDFWNEERNGLKFPYCVNGEFREVWGEQLAKIAIFPFDSIGVIPDEWSWSNRHIGYNFGMYWMKEAQEFLRTVSREPEYCYCEICTAKFMNKYGLEPPREKGSANWKLWTQFRYECTAEAVRYWADIVKKINPRVKTRTLYSVAPALSYQASKGGIAWDMVGYSADLDIAGSDPYINLHNDWTMRISISRDHYVRLATKLLLGSNRKRAAEITLQASRLREYTRDIRPVEVYGNALSVIAHGARAVSFFKLGSVDGTLKFVTNPEMNLQWCRGAFATMEDIEPWLAKAAVPKRIAFIYSRLADDWTYPWQPGKHWYQQRILYFLFDHGYPFDLYYLEQLDFDQIKDYKVLVLPHAYVVNEQQVKVLEKALEHGINIILFPELGGETNIDGSKTKEALMKYEGKADLRTLAGIEGFGSEIFGTLTFQTQSPILPGKEIVPFDSRNEYPPLWGKKVSVGTAIRLDADTHHGGKGSIRLENPGLTRKVCLKITLKNQGNGDLLLDFWPEPNKDWKEYSQNVSVPGKETDQPISATLTIESVDEVALRQSNIVLNANRAYRLGIWIKHEGKTTWIDDVSLVSVSQPEW